MASFRDWLHLCGEASIYTFGCGPQHPFASRGRSDIPRTLLRPPTRPRRPPVVGDDDKLESEVVPPPKRYRAPPTRSKAKTPRMPPKPSAVATATPSAHRGTGRPSRVTAVSVSCGGSTGELSLSLSPGSGVATVILFIVDSLCRVVCSPVVDPAGGIGRNVVVFGC